MKILGIMTGTSCDGLDAACLEFYGNTWRTLWTRSAPYPESLRQRVLDSQLPGATMSLREFGVLHRDLGLWMGATLTRFLRGVSRKELPDAIACHGQTVAHFPAPRKMGFTLQVGDATRIAESTGLTTIAHFRDGDMAAGGEGAPLAPRFHQLLARGQSGVAIHNLGGISNLTYFGPRGKTIAFDTGPANLWIDAAAAQATRGRQRFDRNGKLGGSATPDSVAVRKIMGDPFFKKQPPKSTGRDDFPFSKLLEATSARDSILVATATEITVESIARAYERFILERGLPLTEIRLCGGGAKNLFLRKRLSERLPQVKIEALPEAAYMEAQAFAYFGWLALQGLPLGGSWTGAHAKAPGAHIIPGRNWPGVARILAAAIGRDSKNRAQSKRHPSPSIGRESA